MMFLSTKHLSMRIPTAGRLRLIPMDPLRQTRLTRIETVQSILVVIVIPLPEAKGRTEGVPLVVDGSAFSAVPANVLHFVEALVHADRPGWVASPSGDGPGLIGGAGEFLGWGVVGEAPRGKGRDWVGDYGVDEEEEYGGQR